MTRPGAATSLRYFRVAAVVRKITSAAQRGVACLAAQRVANLFGADVGTGNIEIDAGLVGVEWPAKMIQRGRVVCAASEMRFNSFSKFSRPQSG